MTDVVIKPLKLWIARIAALVVLLIASRIACTADAQPQPQAKPAAKPVEAVYRPITDVPGLPRVLIIGDSVSCGYTLPLRAALTGVANVHRPPQNCGSSAVGLQNLDRWLGDQPWDVIHWHQVLNVPTSWLETSATGMITYGLARGVNEGWLDRSFAADARKGWSALQTKVLPDGDLTDVCGSTDTGDLNFYLKRPRLQGDLHGFGSYLLAGAEIIRLGQAKATMP